MKRKKIPKTQLKVDRESFKEFIKGEKESKSSSHSGRHYGRYKVLVGEEDIIEIIFQVIEVALEAGVIVRQMAIP